MIVLVLLLANSHVGAPPAAAAEAPADNAFLLVAHRGVVTESLTANSLGALEETIRRGYTHVEVDLRCTSDGHAVCLHDRNLMRTVGVDRNVEEITLAELRALVPENVAPSFRTYCERCHKHIGLMPDFKGCPASLTNRFVESVKGSLVEFGLADSALFIGHPLLTRHFSGLGKQS